LPPLRERLEDLSLICEVVLRDLGRRVGRQGYRLTRDGLATLSCYHWPGNIRELANVLERAMILSTDRRLGPAVLDLPTPVSLARAEDRAVASITVSSGTVQTLEAVEREYIRRVLALVGGRIYGQGGAATLLGLKPSTLQSRMKKLGIERQQERVK